MTKPTAVKRQYGAHPLHLLGLIACFAFLGYIISVLGPSALWNPRAWWQSILVWFLGAFIAHDLLLFPFYTLADRSLSAGWRAITAGSHHNPPPTLVSLVNFVRIPTLGSGLLLLLFFPGIIQQGHHSYLAASGQTQDPFLDLWLLLTAAMFALSALAYTVRLGFAFRHRPPSGVPERDDASTPEPAA